MTMLGHLFIFVAVQTLMLTLYLRDPNFFKLRYFFTFLIQLSKKYVVI